MEEVFSDDKILGNDSVESCHFTGATFSHKNRRCSLRLNGVSYSISIQAKNRVTVFSELNESDKIYLLLNYFLDRYSHGTNYKLNFD